MSDLAESTAMLKVTWSQRGIEIAPETTYDEWQEIGKRLMFLEKNIQFAIGDWLNFGEHKWGDKYAQAVLETGYTHSALRNMAYVAKRFDLSSRDDKLTFSHYRAVASLDNEIAQDVLQRAVHDGLSVSQVSELVNSRGATSHSLMDRVAALEEIVRFARHDCSKSVEKLIAGYEETFSWKT
jgi:hypothetical protein